MIFICLKTNKEAGKLLEIVRNKLLSNDLINNPYELLRYKTKKDDSGFLYTTIIFKPIYIEIYLLGIIGFLMAYILSWGLWSYIISSVFFIPIIFFYSPLYKLLLYIALRRKGYKGTIKFLSAKKAFYIYTGYEPSRSP